MEGVVKHCKELPREAVKSPSWEVFVKYILYIIYIFEDVVLIDTC